MKTNKTYLKPSIKWVWAFLFLLAAIVVFSPIVSINELAYPTRIDSNYVKTAGQQYLQESGLDSNKVKPDFYYLPGQFGMEYEAFSVTTKDSVSIKAWYIPNKKNADAATLLMLHDINESKITLLSSAKQFNDRGFNICLVDMRAHGESEGLSFTFGNKESADISLIIDSLSRKINSRNIAIMGIGIGANIAIQAAHKDNRIKCLVAQSPTDSLLNYVNRFAASKWGIVNYTMKGIMRHQLESIIGLKLDTVNMTSLSDCISIPSMFIAGSADVEVPAIETRKVFNASIAAKKEYLPVKNATHYSIIDEAGEPYFNKISVFIVQSMPKKVKKFKIQKINITCRNYLF